jgi:hypothetical protein
VFTGFCLGGPKVRDHWEDLGVGGLVKGKVIPVLLTKHHAMKAYWGSGFIAPLII